MQLKSAILAALAAGVAIAAPANNTTVARSVASSTNTTIAAREAQAGSPLPGPTIPGIPTIPGTPTIPNFPGTSGSGIPGLPNPGKTVDCQKLALALAACAAKGEQISTFICAGTNAPTACKCYEELPKGQYKPPFVDQVCSFINPGQGSGSA